MKIYNVSPVNASCTQTIFLKKDSAVFPAPCLASNGALYLSQPASLVCLKEKRCTLFYTMQHHPAARQYVSYNLSRVCQSSQWRAKKYECVCVPSRFPFKAWLQPACLLDSPRPVGSFPQISPPHSFGLSPTITALCLSVSWCLDAVVHFVNMTAFTRGGLHSSFWIVDRKHIYIGSADMDWRSLSKVTARSNNMSVQGKIRAEDKWARCGQGRHFWTQSGFNCFWSLRNKHWTCTDVITVETALYSG